MKIIITDPAPATRNTGCVANAELHFTDGLLSGLKLIGFSVWERRGGSGFNVTFPARQYSVNGERRSFALLRPFMDPTAQTPLRDAIIQAYRDHLVNEAALALVKSPDERIDEAVLKYPPMFGLRAFPNKQFRLERKRCYINDNDDVCLVTQLIDGNQITDFGKGTVEELDASIVPLEA